MVSKEKWKVRERKSCRMGESVSVLFGLREKKREGRGAGNGIIVSWS